MNIEELKRLAEAATPGPWHVGECYADNGASAAPVIYNANGVDVFSEDGISEPDAEYIAAANPAAVLELIAEIEYRSGKAREHFDACMGCDEALKAVTAQRDELLVALKDARELVEDWGAYAPNYRQEKNDLEGDLAKLDAAISKAEGTL